MKMRFHSRHIPWELLNFEAPVGAEVRANGLCDTVAPEVLSKLKQHGVSVIETRLVWWELERTPGQFDFSRFERDVSLIENSGLTPGVFPWFQHPPTWYNQTRSDHVRFRCLEHGQDSTILSLWDPKTLEVYDRLYGELAGRYADRLGFLYAGISGDFGEVCYPSGVAHYLFSPPHNHTGFWCGDRLARNDFRDSLQQKYSNLRELNDAWGTRIERWEDELMPSLPISTHALARRRDFGDWYVHSLMRFTDAAAELIRLHFPRMEIAVPLGFPFESLWVGQIKSQAVKIAARHRMIARWTGMAFLKSFDRSNVLARRFASAAHFYGTEFATEAALTLTTENAANGLYEALSNGAMMIHDDPQNIFRAEQVHRQLRPTLLVSRPVTSTAVLYPLTNELLEIDGFDLSAFVDRAALLRHQYDYEICDEHMIHDGYLKGMTDLLVLVPTVIGALTIEALQQFLHNGGRVWLCGDATLRVMDEQAALRDSPWSVQDAPRAWESGAGGIYRTSGWPLLASRAQQDKPVISAEFRTVHHDFASNFSPTNCDIRLQPLAQSGGIEAVR